jgi:hypothetical protein
MGSPTWRNVYEVDNFRELGNVDCLASDAIESQYSASVAIRSLINGFQLRIDAEQDLETLYTHCWWIPTATGVSLDVWGRIVGIKRSLRTPSETVVWDDDYYRFLILYKALANISAGDAATMNDLLNRLFSGPVFVLDFLDMTIRVVFFYWMTDLEIAIVKAYGLYTRPGGVGWELYQIDPDEVFGFDGQELQPFNQGIFAPYQPEWIGE